MKGIDNVLFRVKNNIDKVAYLSENERNLLLDGLIFGLTECEDKILFENARDIEIAKDGGMAPSFIDRLTLTKERLNGIKTGVNKLKDISANLGSVLSEFQTEKGLFIKKISVPIGVFAIIYEARPNVTIDTVALAIKSGNGIILRGSKDAINSNIAIVDALRFGIEKCGYNGDFIGLVTDTTHEGVRYLLKQRGLVDVVIPRGGKTLIKSTIEESLIPCIETGLGNCHVYISENANLEMAKKLALSAKISRVSVCNSAESLLLSKKLSESFLRELFDLLIASGVTLFGDDHSIAIDERINRATEEDYFVEYNDYKYSVKFVNSLEECVSHINSHSTHHTDTIVTEDERERDYFFERVDSACVFHNTSTRFSDGFEFGFGAEVGISTQKLHARGPMGIRELTTYKFVATSDYKVR